MIYIASDHAGFRMKEKLKKFLEKKYEIEDLGAEEYVKADDYPDKAKKLAEQVAKQKDGKGVLVCGSGHGMVIAANKIKNIRASVIWNKESARFAKLHTNVNVAVLPARLIPQKEAEKIALIWLKTKFSKEKRHIRRLNKIKKIK